jgi:3-phosphoshikimate 1-carboxyvinyltransferase
MNPALSKSRGALFSRKSGVKPFVVKSVPHLKGIVTLSGDKSIAHRSIIISALSFAKTRIENFPTNKDCLSTLNVFKKLGVKITPKPLAAYRENSITVFVDGKGLDGLVKPNRPIFVGESGTTLRLILGVLAGQEFETRLTAGKSLSQRPMLRVNRPLRMMGAIIKSKISTTKSATMRGGLANYYGERGGFANNYGEKMQKLKIEEYPPITIRGRRLKPITYKLPVPSAQVKSAILLAALFTQGETKVIEPIPTRDHTERMLKLFKADIRVKRVKGQNIIIIKGRKELKSPGRIYIPADISSASFFIVAATLVRGSVLLIKNVCLNPSRIGIIRVLKRMGADIRITDYPCLPARQGLPITDYEPMGDILVKNNPLKGTMVTRKEIPSLIDELPVLMVAASLAKGKTIIKGVEELRVKETDRIRSMAKNLRKMRAKIIVSKAGNRENLIIEGIKQIKGAKIKSFGDHRTAMSMLIAGLVASGTTRIDSISCINKSFPNFLDVLGTLTH